MPSCFDVALDPLFDVFNVLFGIFEGLTGFVLVGVEEVRRGGVPASIGMAQEPC